ncbi:hypothetical protein OIU74_010667 [Salix koriyanagi]|uniref:Uncharacterized protein n=1 Tax=Salix koriyanagi TaxID=2511006 RepID=A0A9Q0TDI6_9ROSI|nr:hypothetical protein OIU74_010667 [Salix koriyanagi]
MTLEIFNLNRLADIIIFLRQKHERTKIETPQVLMIFLPCPTPFHPLHPHNNWNLTRALLELVS